MRHPYKNFKILVLALLFIVLVGALVACNTDTGDKVSAPTDEPISSPSDEILSDVTYFDQSQVIGSEADVTFGIASDVYLDNENIDAYVSVADRNGERVEITVAETGLGLYEIAKAEGEYTAGETYYITLLDEAVTFVDSDERVLNFNIYKPQTVVLEEKEGIVELEAGDYSLDEKGIKVNDNIGAGSILNVKYADGTNAYLKVSEVIPAADGNVLVTVAPTLEEIYKKLDIYSVEKFDCSQLDLDAIDGDSVISGIQQSDMFLSFASAIERVSEATPALSLPDLDDFTISFKASVNDDKNIVIDAVIAYKGGYTAGDQVGKLYVELKYSGVISYNVKASIVAEGFDVDYDFAITANTSHKISLAVQWLDASDDVIIASDDELKEEISLIMADKNNIPSKVLGEAKEFGKTFEVPLCEDFTYVIPNTPITANVGFKWIIGLEVQGEIFTDMEMTSSDTLGVRSVTKEGEDSQEFYHVKSKDASPDLMLMGEATIKTGVRIDAYFSIVGLSDNVRIGIKGDAGIYLTVKGITASVDGSDEKIGVVYGEVGFFVGYQVYGKVFVSFNIVGDEYRLKLFDFGTDAIYTGFVENSSVMNATPLKTINGNIGKRLQINQFVVSEFGIEQVTLLKSDCNYDIKNGYITYFNGQFYITTALHQFTEEITVTLKADEAITKVITINYDDGYVAPEEDETVSTDEPEQGTGEVTEPETPETGDGEVTQPEEPEQGETTDPEEGEVLPEQPETGDGEVTEPETPETGNEEVIQPEEPVIENLVSSLEMYVDGKLYKTISTQYTVSYPLDEPTKFGYTFKGWYFVDEQGNKTIATTTLLGNQVYTMPFNTIDTFTVQAVWEKTYSDYTYVSVPSDIKSISKNGKYFFLNDIDLGGIVWTPVSEFNGIIKGNGKKISNFTIEGPDSFVGFIAVNNGTINNLKVYADVSLNSLEEDVYCGILVGKNNGVINDCYTNGDVNAVMKGNAVFVSEYNGYFGGVVGANYGKIYSTDTLANVYATTNNVRINLYVGGFVGANMSGLISDCSSNSYIESSITNAVSVCDSYAGFFAAYNKASIYSSHARAYKTLDTDFVGGLVAVNDGTISKCYSTGSVTANSNLGGLVGVNNSTVNNSYSTVTVSGKEKTGGLVGANYGKVSYTYASGKVSGEQQVGGLVGYNEGTVSYSFAKGAVTSTKDNWITKEWAGGLVGQNEGTVSNSYRSASQNLNLADVECTAGTKATDSVIKSASFYKNNLKFSTSTWNITSGLPTLR